jgi:hypothetical protein
MCHGFPDRSAPFGARVLTFGVDTYATGALRLKFSSTAPGSWTCSIVCRNVTASASSPYVSTIERSKRTSG